MQECPARLSKGADSLEQPFIGGMGVNGSGQRAYVPGEPVRQEEILGRRVDFLARLEAVVTA